MGAKKPALVMLGRIVRHHSPPVLTDERAETPDFGPLGYRYVPPGALGYVPQPGGGFSTRKSIGVEDERLGPGEHTIPLLVPGNEAAATEVSASQSDRFGNPIPGGRRSQGRAPTRDEIERAIQYELRRRAKQKP